MNLILYGPPGTGKTYNTKDEALKNIDPSYISSVVSREELNNKFNELIIQKRIFTITFHQNFSYEDFVEGIKPELGTSKLSYRIEEGVFKKACKESLILLLKTLNHHQKIESPETKSYDELIKHYNINKNFINYKDKNVVLIIDEINRGNVSSVFGELITLIESSKRLGEDDQYIIQLPYSKELFAVPNNLIIIGTMNTADRSIETLDTALRRRFEFKEMPPIYNILKNIDEDDKSLDLGDLLKKINDRLQILHSKDHKIGHAYFIDINNIKDLNKVFKNKIIPLLEEYFYNDYAKIKMVLGDRFISTLNTSDIIFHSIDENDNTYGDDKIIYNVINKEYTIDDFLSI
jgi:5-methylcytosine-specific restriction protein B